MFERIIEIIVFVISELKQNKHISDIDVDELQKLGYTNSEISTAFSWLADRIEFSEQVVAESSIRSTDSFRIFHDAEKELFTRDALGELIQFQSLGLLNNDHIESLIERALMSGLMEVDTQTLKTFVAGILFSASANADSNRVMLRGNDTIN